jgi:tetratricopeptide (TPR) repeat protein
MSEQRPVTNIIVTDMKQQCRALINSSFCVLAWLLLATGCETPIAYRADSNNGKPPQLSRSEARRTLVDMLQKGKGGGYRAVKVTFKGFTCDYQSVSGPRTLSQRFNEIHDLAVKTVGPHSFGVTFRNAVFLRPSTESGELRSPEGDAGVDHNVWLESLDDAKRLVHAIQAMQYYYCSSRPLADDAVLFADFQEKAKAWRALPVKPSLPEDVRRFKVLAEDAFQKKEFEKAADFYEQGLAVEPLWPDGQLNAALFYGELEMNAQAVLHMKRYLELCPDAKDAKKCRNQMYIWQEKIK